MKKIFFLSLAAFALITLSACTSDEPLDPSSKDNDSELTETPSFRVVSTRDYSAEEIADRIYDPAVTPAQLKGDLQAIEERKEMRRLFLIQDDSAYIRLEEEIGKEAFQKSSAITTYTEAQLEYSTYDHFGNLVKLSGLVAYQHWRSIVWLYQPIRTIDKLLIENHYTITKNDECPSIAGSTLEGALYTFPGAVVSADYQGYGTSSYKFHPYLNQEVTARQQVDFLKVALEFLKGETKYITISPELKTYNLGYSQGGAVTVAVQKYLEQHEPQLMKDINFRGSIAGDGPYNLTNTFNFYSETGVINMPIVLPLIVQGMMKSYPELFTGISLSNYFNYVYLHANKYSKNETYRSYADIVEMMNTKLYSTSDFDDLFAEAIPEYQKKFTGNAKYDFEFEGYDITMLLSSAALNPESTIHKALIQAFERNNVLNGWTPTYPVYFYHCVKDPVVPYVNLKDMPWSADVHFIDERTFFKNHTYGGYKFYVDLIFSSNIESYFGFFNLERGKPNVDDLPGQL